MVCGYVFCVLLWHGARFVEILGVFRVPSVSVFFALVLVDMALLCVFAFEAKEAL